MKMLFLMLLCCACMGTGCTRRGNEVSSREEATEAAVQTSYIEEKEGTIKATGSVLDGNNVIEVSSIESFLEAIGPDRTIAIAPGEYVLSDLLDRYMKYVRWDPTTAGNTLTIRRVENLKIVGLGEEPVRLVVRPYSVFVLNFDDCRNVELENLWLGHAPQKGGCESGVIGAQDCEGLKFVRCDLYGCGTEGLTLERVKGLEFRDSVIRECTYGIMTVRECEDLIFVNSKFVDNEKYYGFDIRDSQRIKFTECLVERNTVSEQLFYLVSCSDIEFSGGAIRNNRAARITNNPRVFKYDAGRQ